MKLTIFYYRIITMRRYLTALLISMLLLTAVSGCQEENSQVTGRQSKMGRIEAMNLNSTIKEKDIKYAALQSELVECKKEITALNSQSTKAADTFMKIFADSAQKSVNLEIENAALKARIKELEK
jgi:septal ring factor EnvC (AmiA/AmiB activator)